MLQEELFLRRYYLLFLKPEEVRRAKHLPILEQELKIALYSDLEEVVHCAWLSDYLGLGLELVVIESGRGHTFHRQFGRNLRRDYGCMNELCIGNRLLQWKLVEEMPAGIKGNIPSDEDVQWIVDIMNS